MALTGEAQEECSHMFRQLALLPHYSSARDCDTVFKAMYQKRATRLGRRAREAGLLTGATKARAVTVKAGLSGGGSGRAGMPLEPYEADDVREAFLSLLYSRQGADASAPPVEELAQFDKSGGERKEKGGAGGTALRS
jgi:hypothetical protein